MARAIELIAKLLVRVRSAAKEYQESAGEIAAVHLLGYPAGGKWEVGRWGNERMASPLRFKVVRDDKGLRVWVCHLPCAVPDVLRKRLCKRDQDWLRQQALAVWQHLHRSLDEDERIGRVTGTWPDPSPRRALGRPGGRSRRGRQR